MVENELLVAYEDLDDETFGKVRLETRSPQRVDKLGGGRLRSVAGVGGEECRDVGCH